MRVGAAGLVSMLAVLLSAVAGCGPSIPTRFVLERDIGDLSYRRYQRVLDVEFPVEGNVAVGHTATYVRRSSRGEIPYVNVFVTVYDAAAGLSAEIRRQVRSLGSYDVSVVDVGGRAWSLDGGEGDRWVLWVSGSRVVKVGGVADDSLVRAVVGEYMGLYPSDLDERGRARDGTASAGDASERAAESEDLELPRSLESETGEGESE
ncbi:hypothetical protein [Sandaracinus amylolyticus]|uniref:hypothetical protein n=1 Tax=Sandaracinus amylolyticus TaxID=927083 RepID=UPI001F1E0B03|nr:hypothetical protein [Sandaracinus amylolyticus]UJR78956.1 Hypothetical protein I5071_9890 [Sandaracinus amylolyticus]